LLAAKSKKDRLRGWAKCGHPKLFVLAPRSGKRIKERGATLDR